jgi:hypothetical protein
MDYNVREQVFTIEGWERPFRNIEGSIGPIGEKPAAVLTAHYDSVISPGANDDAAGISVILEAGRLLAQMDNPPPVYIVAVSIEESSNPIIYSKVRDSAIQAWRFGWSKALYELGVWQDGLGNSETRYGNTGSR